MFFETVFLYNELFKMNTTMMDNERYFLHSTSGFDETLNLKFREDEAIRTICSCLQYITVKKAAGIRSR